MSAVAVGKTADNWVQKKAKDAQSNIRPGCRSLGVILSFLAFIRLYLK
jgi:hypothetical protein